MLLNPAAAPMSSSAGDHRKRRREDSSRSQDPKKVMSEHDALAAALEKPNNAALRLLGLLLQCAERVAVENLDGAAKILPQILELSSPFGSPAQRVGAYFSNALQARVLASRLGNYNCSSSVAPTPSSHLINLQNALQTHNSLTPLIKFSHFTSNQAILKALEGQDRVHIIDLDIMQGLQWPGLFHMLATKKLKSLRITGLGPSSEALETTGQRLSEFAGALNIPSFHFTAVEGKIGNLDDAVGRLKLMRSEDEEETVIVHWTKHGLYDVTGNDLRVLRLLALVRPRLITIVEQDLSHGGSFLGRFVEALHYYSALFDALGDGFGKDDLYRHVVERQVLGVEIRNIVAGGRSGEVKIERWSDELVRVGFRPVPLGGCPVKQASMLLGMFRAWKGYTLVEEEDGSLKLGWKDLSLLTATAWEP